MKSIITKVFTFVTHDIWHLNAEKLSRREAFWARQLKVFLITLREFNNGKVNVRASSLAFYLLLSIVPMFALMFAVSSGFGIEGQIRGWLTDIFPDQQDVVNKLLEFAASTIDAARGGWIAGVGIIMILWSSMSLFISIEEAMNDIWQSKVSRSWTRRFADYLSIMLIAPVLLLLSNSITVTFRFYLSSVTEQIPVLGAVTPVLFTVLLPLLLIWLLFIFLYLAMPNVKVKFMPALTSALIAGTTFYLVEQLYLFSQVSIARYNAIYGSLAAIPLFLLCARLGWQIVLFGAELSFAYQNIDNYEYKMPDKGNISHRNFAIQSLYVLRHIVGTFSEGSPPVPVSRLADDLKLSVRSLNVILEALHSCELLLSVNTGDKDNAYTPAIDIGKLTVSLALHRLENLGELMSPEISNPEIERLAQIIDQIYNHDTTTVKIDEL